MKRLLNASLFLSSVLVVVGCGSSSKTPTTANPAAGTPVSIRNNAIGLGSMAYGDNPIVITAGTTLTWTNQDSIAYTSTADSAGTFDSGNLTPGQSYSYKFDKAGTYTYHCTYHSRMMGTVQVK